MVGVLHIIMTLLVMVQASPGGGGFCCGGGQEQQGGAVEHPTLHEKHNNFQHSQTKIHTHKILRTVL